MILRFFKRSFEYLKLEHIFIYKDIKGDIFFLFLEVFIIITSARNTIKETRYITKARYARIVNKLLFIIRRFIL